MTKCKACGKENKYGQKRYYIDHSSIFVSEKYDAEKIKSAVATSGGSNIRLSHNFGWSNQPKVVTFLATESELEAIKSKVENSLGGLAKKWGVMIREKDW